MNEIAWNYEEMLKRGLWLKEGDTVGLIEPNLYTGVGVVKEEYRGEIIELLPHLSAAIVKYPQGNSMIFLRDLLFYGRPELNCLLCQGSKEILKQTERTMGYTLTDGETIDEQLVPCPLCENKD